MGKFLGSLTGKLIGGVVSLVMIGGGIYYSLTKKDNIGEEFKRPSSVIELLDKTYHISLIDEFKKKVSEKLKITVEIDKEKDILYFGNYTQNYDQKDWSGTKKENIPVHKRHTNINSVYSKTFILHPPEVKISKQEQKAYLVPEYGWDNNLKPYEEHKEAQMVIEGGEKIIDLALSKIPIPFFKEFIEQGLQNATKKERKHYQELFRKINQGYTATIIPSQIPNKIIGYTETARESKISLETNNLKENAEIYLWAKIALGNPSKASHGSLPNKYGELENIVVKFSLYDNKTKIIIKQTKSELEEYLFQGKELKELKFAPEIHTRFRKGQNNPFCIFPGELERYRIWGLERICLVKYHIPLRYHNIWRTGGGYQGGEITQHILKFKNKKAMEEYTEKNNYGKNNFNLKEYRLGLIKNNNFLAISNYNTWINGFYQNLLYKNIILNYVGRIKPDQIIFEGEKRTKEQFKKRVKERFQKYEYELETLKLKEACSEGKISVKEADEKIKLLKSKISKIPYSRFWD